MQTTVYLVAVGPKQSETLTTVLHFVGEQCEVVERDDLAKRVTECKPLSIWLRLDLNNQRH